jgi:hypothetical protein
VARAPRAAALEVAAHGAQDGEVLLRVLGAQLVQQAGH